MMESILRDGGVDIAEGENDADVVVLNTCTVKRPTEQRILDNIKRLYKKGTSMVIAGCMASANPDVVRKHAPNAAIVSTQNIASIAEAVENASHGTPTDYSRSNVSDKLMLFNPGSSVVARVPVSEGCLSSCSFCETKFARGRLNSFSEDLIIKAIEMSVGRGAREIELTSQDMGAYGADRNTNIAMLMKRIAGMDGDFKVRVGMLNPDHLHKYLGGIIDAFDSDRFYRFLHLPVQSGSESVLNDMGRRCMPGEFRELARRLRSGVKGLAIETDIIVGYPTETEQDFTDTLSLLRDVRPEVTNISKFGARHHARASKMGQLANEVVKDRSARASRLVRRMQREMNSRSIGTPVRALMTELTGHSINGRTGSYRQVVVPEYGQDVRLGSYADLNVYDVSSNVLYCRVV